MAEKRGNLFRLRTTKVEASAKVTRVKTCIYLLHRRLGHRDLNAVKRLVKKDLATRIKITECVNETVCEHCI